MKYVYAIVLIITCCNSLSAQESLNFHVVDNNGVVVPYVHILLVKEKDSSMVKGAVSNAEGYALFQNIEEGNYILKTSGVGYKDKIQSMFVQHKYKDSIYKIYLEPTIASLKEVTIKAAKRPLYEQKAGMTIMNVNSLIVSGENNALNLLKKMPGVDVGFAGEVRLYGKGVSITINNKPLPLKGQELINYLKTIPSDKISKIEGKPNPTADYDAEGAGGVINLVTQKVYGMGFNGSVYGGVGYNGNWNHSEGGNISFRSPKLFIQGGIGYDGAKGEGGGRVESIFSDNKKQILQNQGSIDDPEKYSGLSKQQALYWNVGLDYYIDNFNTLSFTFNQNNGRGRENSNIYIRDYLRDSLLWSTDEQGNGTNKIFSNTATLSYTTTFDSASGKSLNIDLIGLYNTENTHSNSYMYGYEGDFVNILDSSSYLQDFDYISKFFCVKIDYSQVFNASHQIKVGAKVNLTEKKDNLFYQSSDISESMENNFKYRENINAIYAQYNYTYKTGELSVGLRGELTLFNTYQKSMDSTFKAKPYFNVFPVINYMQRLGSDKHILNMGYRYRLSRPNYSWLNPFDVRSNAVSSWSGNPYLKPEYIHLFSLGYTYKQNFMFYSAYHFSTNSIRYVEYLDAQTMTQRGIMQNIDTRHGVEVSITGQLRLFERWNLMLTGSFDYSTFTLSYKGKKSKINNYGLFVSWSNNIDILPSFSASLNVWGKLIEQTLYDKDVYPKFSIDVGLKKNFLKDQLSVQLTCEDILNSYKRKVESRLPDGQINKKLSYWQSRILWLRVYYNFGKTIAERKNNRTISIEGQDENRLRSGR